MGFQAQPFSDKRLYEHFGSVLSRSLIGNYKGKPMRGALQTPVNPQPEAFKGPEVPLHFSDRSPLERRAKAKPAIPSSLTVFSRIAAGSRQGRAGVARRREALTGGRDARRCY
jgi:hypothetical protein